MKQKIIKVFKVLSEGLAPALPKALAVTVLLLVMPAEHKGMALGIGASVVALELMFETVQLVAVDVIKRNQQQKGEKNQ